MDRPRRKSSWSTGTETSLTSSETSLSEDTQQIRSYWERLVPIRDHREHRDAGIARVHQPAYGAAPLLASPREAALRRPPAFAQLTSKFPQRDSSASKCRGDDTDAPQVPVTTSLCYAALVLLTTILALTIGLVLVRLVPDTNGESRSLNAVQGYKARRGVPRTAIAPPPVAKTLAPATVPHARGDGLLRAMSSTDVEKREQATTARIIPAQGNSGNKTVENSGVLAKNSTAVVSSGAEGSEEGYRHHLCDIVFYTHCPRTAREFYFSSSTNSCARATTSYGTEVCNRSPNKFASEASCHKSCVHPSTPSGRCLDPPVFSQCRSADLKRRLWFFEGEACQPWDFPSGRCPMDDGDLFGSREECAHRCLGNQTYLSLCRTPPSGTCTTHHLKYPYFAVRVPGALKMQCLKTSALSLQRQLCLTGTNRFPSIGSCKRTCAPDASSMHQNRVRLT